MDKLQKFSRLISNKLYFFHLHTDLTDGKLTLEKYFEYASQKKIMLIFTEHIRREPTYDWKNYIALVHEHGHLAGFEAKVLPGGKLDIPAEALNLADVIGVAVHSFPKEKELILSLRGVFEKYSRTNFPVVWVHPYTSNIEKQYAKSLYIEEVMRGFESLVYVEFNVKKKNFSKTELNTLSKKYNTIIGCDAHTKEDLKLCEEWFC